MYKLSHQPRPSSRTLPPGLTVLALSWVGSQFEAVAVHRGTIAGSWSSPDPVSDLEAFAKAVKEARTKTGFTGTAASLVLAQPRLGQQLCQAPPAEGAAMDRVVKRLVDRQKMFQDEAAWSYFKTIPTKSSDNILLFLYPRLLLDRIMDSAEKAGLNLQRVMPFAAVLRSLLGDLPVKPDEVTMLAAEAGGQTAVLVGRGDGQVLLGRLLEANWNRSDQDLALELNRTSLFINQQFEATIGSVHLIGPGANDHLASLEAGSSLSVKLAGDAEEPFSWAKESLRVSGDAECNLVPREQRHAPQRRLLRKVTVAVAAVLAVSSLGVALYFQVLVKEERGNIERLRAQLLQLQRQQQQLHAHYLELVRQREYVKQVGDDRPPPLALWLFGYLGQVLPSDLAVTNFTVRNVGATWDFQLAGLAQPAKSPTPTAAANLTAPPTAMAKFTNELGRGPFHAQLLTSSSTETRVRTGLSMGSLAKAALQLRPTRPEASSTPQHFLVEGSIR